MNKVDFRVIEIKLGSEHYIDLSVIQYLDGKVLIKDFGIIKGWFEPGDWIVGNSHKGGGGLKLRSINLVENVAIFEDSTFALP